MARSAKGYLKMTWNIVFINICNATSSPYVNPIFLQTHAAICKDLIHEADVRIYDGACGDALPKIISLYDRIDMMIAALENENHIDILNSAIGIGCNISNIMLCGGLVTNAVNDFVLNSIVSSINSLKVKTFVGRDSIKLARKILKTLKPNAEGIGDGIEERHVSARPLVMGVARANTLPFSSGMRDAVKEGGLTLLVEGVTRGCSHRCLYCHLNNRNETSGLVQKVTGNPAEALLNLYKVFGDTCIYQLTDENFFGGDHSHLEQVISFSKKLLELGFRAKIGVDTRIDSIWSSEDSCDTRKLRVNAWSEMILSGLSYSYFGAESFSKEQVKRYGKLKEFPSIFRGIECAQEFGIDFTVGLIIFDPMVTKDDIKINIETIERLGIHSNVASLLKPMRLNLSNRYVMAHLMRGGVDLYGVANAGIGGHMPINFSDSHVRRMWPYVYSIHSLFAESGYRHSDCAAHFSLLGQCEIDNRGYIPSRVIKFEIEFLRHLLSDFDEEKLEIIVRDRLRNCIDDCAAWLHRAAGDIQVGSPQNKILSIYRHVFEGIGASLNDRELFS